MSGAVVKCLCPALGMEGDSVWGSGKVVDLYSLYHHDNVDNFRLSVIMSKEVMELIESVHLQLGFHHFVHTSSPFRPPVSLPL